MHNEIMLLKKQINRLQLGLLCCIALLLLFILLSFKGKPQSFGIIRAKGIVIEDSTGRDRILIGAPIPASADRVRTDTALVRRYWSKRYKNPDQFMKWYSNYSHSAIGMVVLNEEGFDRVQIGDKLSDPNSGKRMFEAAGITWNDPKGWERGGAGVNTTKEGVSRSVMGVDGKGGESGRLMIGMSEENGQWFLNKEAFTGIKYVDTDGKVVWEQQVQKK